MLQKLPFEIIFTFKDFGSEIWPLGFIFATSTYVDTYSIFTGQYAGLLPLKVRTIKSLSYLCFYVLFFSHVLCIFYASCRFVPSPSPSMQEPVLSADSPGKKKQITAIIVSLTNVEQKYNVQKLFFPLRKNSVLHSCRPFYIQLAPLCRFCMF